MVSAPLSGRSGARPLKDRPVPLIRYFEPIARQYEAAEDTLDELWGVLGKTGRTDWATLIGERRVVILADAGAGKTFELKAQAERLAAQNRPAFFIRIEDIGDDFGEAFEVGSKAGFDRWLAGTDTAWFFLDSVDEVRLDAPRAFEAALGAFAERVRAGLQRAHIYVSSRPYAWRARTDRGLIDELLPFEPVLTEATGEDGESTISTAETSEEPTESVVCLYRLAPLDADDIRIFAGHRGVADTEPLIEALERTNLFELAQRPFDLDDICAMWRERHSLDSRLAVLRAGVRRRLAPPPPGGMSRGTGPSLERALAGAQTLALAVTLTGLANVRLPGATGTGPSVDAELLLSGWTASEISALLARGVFNDPIYGTVRFRHREVRELLAAEWLANRLRDAAARPHLEALIFRECYGQASIAPRLRPILPWLVLFDAPVRDRALAMHPEIATEGGDAAQLPLPERQAILTDLVTRIVDRDAALRGADNEAIARIAQPDLAADTLALIERHAADDDALFFLGRLVWQGRMSAAAEPLVAVATDPARGVYARLVAIRAVAATLGEDARRPIWRTLLKDKAPLPRRLLAELVDGAAANGATIALVVASLDRLPPYDRFEATGLTDALDRLIARLPLNRDDSAEQPLAALSAGLDALLSREPHVERGECQVSEAHRWLMGPAMHTVERLVGGRAAASLDPSSMAILLKVPALRYWGGGDETDRRSELGKLIPRWFELNDALFWTAITERRAIVAAAGERLIDDWPVTLIGHLWSFGVESFPRVLAWIESRSEGDDRQVALALAFRIYVQNGRPRAWREALKRKVRVEPALADRLSQMLRPPPSPQGQSWRVRERRYRAKQRRRELSEAKARARFAAQVRADPAKIREPGLPPGEMSWNQYHLLRSIEGQGRRASRSQGSDWRALEGEFGGEVARAYRDAALRHWRAYRPLLRSEGGADNSIPYTLIFGMAGLDIEADDDGLGVARLGADDVRHALRYAPHELNGFPRWLEPLFHRHPDLVLDFIWGELAWELAQTESGQSLHYMLHDIVYHASWLHAPLVPRLMAWLETHGAANGDVLRWSRHILVSGHADRSRLVRLSGQMAQSKRTPEDLQPIWFALWVDTAPDAAIPALEAHLAALDDLAASIFVQSFLSSLLGGRHGGGGPNLGGFRTPAHLQALYTLTHRHVRVGDDIERAGKGVYSPTLRDDAQDAREQLFGLLGQIAGEESFRALKALAEDHPEPSYRTWMRHKATERATVDGDVPAFANEEVEALLGRVGADHISQR